MEMNWVLIVVIAILAGYTIAGYGKGFLKIVYSLVSWIVVLVVVICASPYIQNYLKNNTNIYQKAVAYCEETIREKAEQEIGNVTFQAPETLTENEWYAVISQMFPEDFLENLQEKTTEMTGGLLENSGIYEKTAVAMADLFLQGISTVAAIIVGLMVSALISAMFGFVSKIPLIGFANKILGLAAGAANGMLIVWMGFYLAAALCATSLGSTIVTSIYKSEFLTFLYENNLLLTLLP